ncbi:MAG: hypothetical protein PUH93_04180 [Clostridia bacterium]|nr:hypothetical protein [Clostridia bacterium]
MKNVKKIMAKHKSEILPDKKIKDNVRRELGFDGAQYSAAYAHGGEQTADVRRNKIIVLCAAVLAVVLLLAAIIPALMKNRKPITPSVSNKFAQITDAASFYAYGAASVGTLLASSDSLPTVRKLSDSLPTVRKLSASAETEKSRLTTVNRYMSLVESLLSEQNIVSNMISGEHGYRYGMTVKHTDLHGNEISYRLYYDKYPTTTESEDKNYYGINRNDKISELKISDGESPDYKAYNGYKIDNAYNIDKNNDKTEKDYSIKGILLIGGAEYFVEGVYETENDGGESESELYFKAFTNAEKTSYIEVRQKHERETKSDETEIEQEYVYSVYVDGVLTERTEIEYETEKDELELKMSVTKDGETETILFKGEFENGERILRARGKVNGQTVSFRVYVLNDGYRYVFDDGSFSDFERDDDDGDDDNDDNNDDGDDDDSGKESGDDEEESDD